jgi:hypothetical protein
MEFLQMHLNEEHLGGDEEIPKTFDSKEGKVKLREACLVFKPEAARSPPHGVALTECYGVADIFEVMV